MRTVLHGGPFAEEYGFQYAYAYKRLCRYLGGGGMASDSFSPMHGSWLAQVDDGMRRLGIGGAPVLLRLTAQGGCLRLEVADGSSEEPVRHDHPGVDGGFGLLLVERLCTRWAVEHVGDGKYVWCDCPFSRSTAAAPSAAGPA